MDWTPMLCPRNAAQTDETLHFTHAFIQFSHSDTSREFVIRIRQQRATVRLGIFSRQLGNLQFKTLKAQVESNPWGTFRNSSRESLICSSVSA